MIRRQSPTTGRDMRTGQVVASDVTIPEGELRDVLK